jgi:hypothetical protein
MNVDGITRSAVDVSVKSPRKLDSVEKSQLDLSLVQVLEKETRITQLEALADDLRRQLDEQGAAFQGMIDQQVCQWYLLGRLLGFKSWRLWSRRWEL